MAALLLLKLPLVGTRLEQFSRFLSRKTALHRILHFTVTGKLL
jgi:hypothetical protein